MQEKIKDFWFGWRFLCVGCVSVISRWRVGGAGKGMVTDERMNE